MASDLAGADGLALTDIQKSFGAAHVLRGINLHIRSGEFLSLLGPSGCGKTTLLRIIAGLESADSGHVVLDGADLSQLPANRRPVNTVFQSYALFPHLNVTDNIGFGLASRSIDRKIIAQKTAHTMEMLKITELSKRYPSQLSGGQKQRVALARALVNEPRVLLLDEPMSALDAKLRTQVQIELRRLQRRLGTTFVLVTHDQDEAMAVSDRIVVMNRGVIEQIGSPRDLFDRPASRFVAEFLGTANLTRARPSQAGDIDTTWGKLRATTPVNWIGGLVGIRPERVIITTSAKADRENTVRAKVREIIPRAGRDEVFFEDNDLRAIWSAGTTLSVGDIVHLTLPTEHLFFVPDDEQSAHPLTTEGQP